MEITITKDNFDSAVINSDIPVLIDFWALWCAPCRMLAPAVAAAAEKYDGVIKVGKVNVDEEPEISISYGVSSIPTVIMFKDGEEAGRSVGAVSQDELFEIIDKMRG